MSLGGVKAGWQLEKYGKALKKYAGSADKFDKVVVDRRIHTTSGKVGMFANRHAKKAGIGTAAAGSGAAAGVKLSTKRKKKGGKK